jgi:hypothetical protein
VAFGLVFTAGARAVTGLVVLVRPSASDAELTDAWNRLEAELHIHAFEARTQELELGSDPAATLRRLGSEAEAVAAFGFVRRDGVPSLEVVLLERGTGNTTSRRLPLARGSDAASLIAVRAVDLLRSSLQEFPEQEVAEPEPPPAPPGPPPAAASPSRPAEPVGARAFSIALEGAFVWPGTRFGLGFGPALAVFHHPSPWFHWGVWITGPVFGMRLETDSGSATIHQELGLLEARVLLFRAGQLEVDALVGGGLWLLQASGRAREPLRSEDDAVWSGVLEAGLHAEQGLGAGFALGLSVRALGQLPGLGVALARERAAFQQPALQGALGVALGF